MSDFLNPSNANEPNQRVRCPIHGFIHYSQNERKIIDHQIFRRLRHIRQLALTEYVYPGACHSRFEHSLGVMELATQAFDALWMKRGESIEREVRQVEGFESNPKALSRQLVRLASLLHDVGHAPFSHAAEKIYHQEGHESFTHKILSEPGLLRDDIETLFGETLAHFLGVLFGSEQEMPPQLQILKQIFSGEMDADRADYLVRDSYHCGVDYGRFDHRRLIESLDVIESEIGLELGLGRKDIHSLEALILARYQMTLQVYSHRLRRIYDKYLEEYHRCVFEESTANTFSILNENDITMMARMFRDSEDDSSSKGRWARRIIRRSHHKLLHEVGPTGDQDLLRGTVRFAKRLREEFPAVDFIFDSGEGKIHKLALPEGEDGIRIPISGIGAISHAGRESHILKRIPQRFFTPRIFSDARDADKAKIRKFIDSEWKNFRSVL